MSNEAEHKAVRAATTRIELEGRIREVLPAYLRESQDPKVIQDMMQHFVGTVCPVGVAFTVSVKRTIHDDGRTVWSVDALASTTVCELVNIDYCETDELQNVANIIHEVLSEAPSS